jgi:hypothetical protein
MKITASRLIRWSGLAALVAGIIFAGIQPIHPPDVLSSVTTTRWAIVHIFSTAMCFLALFGITGLYARQVGKRPVGLVWPAISCLVSFGRSTRPMALSKPFSCPS